MDDGNGTRSRVVIERHPTATISLVVLIGVLVLRPLVGMLAPTTAKEPTLSHVVFWIAFLAGLRISIFWFQTLIHGIEHAREENRVAVVLAHIFLGVIMSYGYYYWSRAGEASELSGVGEPDSPETIADSERARL